MATFDSPILRCEICQRIVLRDTTWEDCAKAHHCEARECPHRDEFTATRRDRTEDPAPDTEPTG